MKLPILIFVLLPLVLAAPKKCATPDCANANDVLVASPKSVANDLVDDLMDTLSQLMIECGFDPMKFEDFVIGFEQEIFGITFSGHIGFTEGFGTGMSSLVRSGDALMDEENGITTLVAPLRLSNLKYGYALWIEFMGFSVSPSASISMESVSIDMIADADLVNPNLVVQKLDIHTIRGLDIDIDALGPLDFLLEFLAELISGVIKGIVGNILEGPIRFLINLILATGGGGGNGECGPALHSLPPFDTTHVYKGAMRLIQ